MGRIHIGVKIVGVARKLCRVRIIPAIVFLGLLESIVSILGHLVVRFSVFMRLNAWLKQKVMFASALLIGKEVLIALSLPTP